MLKKFTIYGERGSGTNYLEDLIRLNFDAHLSWDYGWKHFFGFQDEKLKNSNNTLFICIVRNLPDWINSFFRYKHHIPLKFIKNVPQSELVEPFLNDEFFSVNDAKHNFKTWSEELMTDRNIYTGERYKNIYELRHTKIKWMIEDLPKKVNNYIFIRYEDLIDNFEETMTKIKDKGLRVKNDINFPLNLTHVGGQKDKIFKKKENTISSEYILSNPNLIRYYEEKLYDI